MTCSQGCRKVAEKYLALCSACVRRTLPANNTQLCAGCPAYKVGRQKIKGMNTAAQYYRRICCQAQGTHRFRETCRIACTKAAPGKNDIGCIGKYLRRPQFNATCRNGGGSRVGIRPGKNKYTRALLAQRSRAADDTVIVEIIRTIERQTGIVGQCSGCRNAAAAAAVADRKYAGRDGGGSAVHHIPRNAERARSQFAQGACTCKVARIFRIV